MYIFSQYEHTLLLLLVVLLFVICIIINIYIYSFGKDEYCNVWASVLDKQAK